MSRTSAWQLAWLFTTSLNRKVTIWWGFFRQTAPAAVPAHVGADSLKKPHHIVTLRFSEVVKDHATYVVSSLCYIQLPVGIQSSSYLCPQHYVLSSDNLIGIIYLPKYSTCYVAHTYLTNPYLLAKKEQPGETVSFPFPSSCHRILLHAALSIINGLL